MFKYCLGHNVFRNGLNMYNTRVRDRETNSAITSGGHVSPLVLVNGIRVSREVIK